MADSKQKPNLRKNYVQPEDTRDPKDISPVKLRQGQARGEVFTKNQGSEAARRKARDEAIKSIGRKG